MGQHVELLLDLALNVAAAMLAQVPPERPFGGHRRDRFDGRGHVHQERTQILAVGDAVQLLDEEFRQSRAPEMHDRDSLLMVLDGWGLEHPARADVGHLDGGQVLRGEFAVAVGEQAARLAQARAIERITHAPGIGEVRLADAVRQVFFECRPAPPA